LRRVLLARRAATHVFAEREIFRPKAFQRLHQLAIFDIRDVGPEEKGKVAEGGMVAEVILALNDHAQEFVFDFPRPMRVNH